MRLNNKESIRNLTGQGILFLILQFAFISLASAQSELPKVTLRFGNPVFDAVSKEYSVDVEFQANMENIRVFGINVRFFYEKDALDFISFNNFAPGYGTINPNPPMKRPLAKNSGSLFGFESDAVYINGAVQLKNPNSKPVSITQEKWTRVFSMHFNVPENEAIPESEFKPQIVWDMKGDPFSGGFMPGSAGVVVTVIRGDSNMAAVPVIENVIHHNWD